MDLDPDIKLALKFQNLASERYEGWTSPVLPNSHLFCPVTDRQIGKAALAYVNHLAINLRAQGMQLRNDQIGALTQIHKELDTICRDIRILQVDPDGRFADPEDYELSAVVLEEIKDALGRVKEMQKKYSPPAPPVLQLVAAPS